MSTNKSQNLGLHLWEPEDNFLRSEFNENFAAIDSAVNAEQTAREAAVQAVKAVADAAFCPDKLPYVTGRYCGDGTYGRTSPNTLTPGFKPSLVLIGDGARPRLVLGPFAHGLDNITIKKFTEEEVSWYSISSAEDQANIAHEYYFYIAFR